MLVEGWRCAEASHYRTSPLRRPSLQWHLVPRLHCAFGPLCTFVRGGTFPPAPLPPSAVYADPRLHFPRGRSAISMDETAPLLPSSRPPSTPDNESHDPSDPQSWPQWYKWSLTALLAFISFTVTFTCISLVPIANHIVADLDSRNPPRLDGNTGSTSSSGVLLVTIWELGEAAGPLLIAPLSEIYGRAMVFNVTNVLFILTTALGAVSDSTGLLILARFLTGTAVASNVLNPAVIGDIFPPSQRGTAMSMVMLTPLVGGAVGPAVAGAIAQEAGWRRVLWMSVGLATAAEVLFMLGFRETYSGALLKKKARAGLDMKSAELEAVNEGKSLVWEGIKRPVTIFCSSFILQILSLYGSVVFSFFYVVSTTLPGILEEEYGWAPAMVGSSFLSFSEHRRTPPRARPLLITTVQASAPSSPSSPSTSSSTASTLPSSAATKPRIPTGCPRKLPNTASRSSCSARPCSRSP